MSRTSDGGGVRRRAVLGTLAGGATGAGCLRRARTAMGWQDEGQLMLTLKTVPADADPYALRLARALAGWYRDAGIEVNLVPVAEDELLRQVLLNGNFDLFVARLPFPFDDPDRLYSLLHSRFAQSKGWQNPFGFADLEVDDLLERQRQERGEKRAETAAALQSAVARAQPCTVLGFPDDVRAADADGVERRDSQPRMSRTYLALDPGTKSLRVAVTDGRATENLNPLSAEYRRSGVLIEHLYDALGYRSASGTAEWLASSWTFTEDGDRLRASVRLRPDCRWHDGKTLTADDVAFTYDLLADTSLGEAAEPVPAPTFQGRSELVEEVRATDARTAEFDFGECSREVAVRAFTVPILPERVWSERTDTASVGGVEVGSATEALVTANVPPVGSGPLRHVSSDPGQSVVLERFDDHFLAGENPPDGFDEPAFERLVVRPTGGDSTAVKVVAAEDAALTGTPVGAGAVPRIGRSDDLRLLVDGSTRPYVIGYNTGSAPLSNPRFRNTLAQLVDKSHLVSEVFRGYARPASSLLAETDWVPRELEWDGEDPTAPFLGAGGELDRERARAAFQDAGFKYEGEKIVRNH